MGFRPRSDSITSLTNRISRRRASIASTKSTSSHDVLLPADLQVPLLSDDFEWVSAIGGHIPTYAIQGGIERTGEPLFICRAHHRDGLHPGKAGLHLRTGACIGYAWQEVDVHECQVLCGHGERLRWVQQDGPLVIKGFVPVHGGFERTGEPLYIAKAVMGGSQQLGKCGIHIKHGASFAFGGKERAVSQYMVLAYA